MFSDATWPHFKPLLDERHQSIRAGAPLCWGEPVEVVWAPESIAPCMHPWWGVPGPSIWEETLGRHKTPWRDYISWLAWERLVCWWRWLRRVNSRFPCLGFCPCNLTPDGLMAVFNLSPPLYPRLHPSYLLLSKIVFCNFLKCILWVLTLQSTRKPIPLWVWAQNSCGMFPVNSAPKYLLCYLVFLPNIRLCSFLFLFLSFCILMGLSSVKNMSTFSILLRQLRSCLPSMTEKACDKDCKERCTD